MNCGLLSITGALIGLVIAGCATRAQPTEDSPKPADAAQATPGAVGPSVGQPPTQIEVQRHGVTAAARTGEAPQRLSTFAAPSPFDAAAWRLDPQGYAQRYAAVAEPSRGEVTADGEADAPPLVLVSPPRLEVAAGGSAIIVLDTLPFAPASFFSEDMASFANGLPYITLVADAAGRVAATVRAGAGVTQLVRVHAASPVARGTILVCIDIRP